MNADLLDDKAILLGSNSFKRNIDEIVFKKRRCICVNCYSDNRESFLQILDNHEMVKVIDLDLCIYSDRKDCIEQIIRIAKDFFPDKPKLYSLFTQLCDHHISDIYKDDIVNQFFQDLTLENDIILVFGGFENYANYIKEKDYHRLVSIINKQKGKISYVVHSQSSISPFSPTMSRFLELFNCTGSDSYKSFKHDAILYELLSKEEQMKTSEVYISYAWGEESEDVANKICTSLEVACIKYHRDKKDLHYKGNIRDFEERIGRGNNIILVISDDYLKSKDCMYEIYKIKENGDIYNRVYPIILNDATIFDPIKRVDYIEYWENETMMLDKRIRSVGAANLAGLRDDIDNYSKYREIIPEIMTLLSRMNCLSPQILIENNFSQIIEAIRLSNKKDFNVSRSVSSESTSQQRTVNQFGTKSIYIEKNEGDITIN